MDLPNKDRVTVEDKKVRNYLRDESHPDGYGKRNSLRPRVFTKKSGMSWPMR
jgi:hypothetical protein